MQSESSKVYRTKKMSKMCVCVYVVVVWEGSFITNQKASSENLKISTTN